MRAKRTLRVLVLVLGFGLLPLTAVLAHHGPTVENVVAAADSLGIACGPPTTEVDCGGPPVAEFRHPLTIIKPGTGPLSSVYTQVDAHTNGIHDFLAEDQAWFTTLHGVGCADSQVEQGAIAQFMRDMAAYFAQSTTGGTYGPSTVGECSLVGHLTPPPPLRAGAWVFDVTSTTGPATFPTPIPTPAPTATPTPIPTASPTATPKPTAIPTATPKPTAKPIVTAKPTATATATASETPSASASASESPSVSPTATPSPSPTPEQSVKGATFTPDASPAEGAPDQGVGGWPGTVPGAGNVSTKPGDLGGSAMGALILLVAMGFIGELFNNTMETNYDRILGWWKKSWVGRIGSGIGGLFG